MIPLDSFNGIKENIKDSLLDGFVCRNEKSDQYFCIYKNNNSFYDEGFIHESEINDLLDETKSYLSKDQINIFFKISNTNRNLFFNMSIIKKIDLLLKYFGVEEIFGKSFQDLSLKEAIYIIETE